MHPFLYRLLTLLLAGLALATNPAHAQQQIQIHPEHLTALSLATQPLPLPEASNPEIWYDITPDEAASITRSLISEPEPVELAGGWRCRSIQSGGLLIAYRYFNCRITNLAGGLMFFEKLTGSQRRTGLLIPQPNGSHMLIGGFTVNEDPTIAYSGLLGAAGVSEGDTVGLLVPRASEDRVLMVFAEDLPARWEIYEMRR